MAEAEAVTSPALAPQPSIRNLMGGGEGESVAAPSGSIVVPSGASSGGCVRVGHLTLNAQKFNELNEVIIECGRG